MKTITEDYVSDETFKLLKEKGFDDSCCRFVVESDETYHRGAPTLQMARKWLLKKYNIFICILFLEESNGFGYTIENILKKKYIATSENSSYKEPEEAAERAIKYCLINLI